MNPLPPDPYLALGVSRTALIAEIRSVHRKRVLKCHPDKVTDETLKAEKQDEFQKVQQAYELLSDENKRAQYDQQVRLMELRKEMGRGGGVPVGGGANIYSAEPRYTSTTYRSKQPPPPPPPQYPSRERYDSDEARYSAPRRSSSYETKPKTSSFKDDERRARRKEEERFQKDSREADRDRESKRDKEAHADRKKRRDKDRKRASEEKTSNAYIESESDSEDLRTTSKSRMKFPEIVAMAQKMAREETRRSPEIIDAAERRREKTKAALGNAYRYINTAKKGAETLKVNIPAVPEPPAIGKIDEEDEIIMRSSRRMSRRTSAETPTSSRRAQNSSRSRDSPRLSSKDKKRSDPRMMEEIPIRAKASLYTQKSAPPEVSSSREKPLRSNTMDDKYGSKGPFATPGFARASTFHGTEKSQSRSSQKPTVVYESSSDSESDSDNPSPKQTSPSRDRPILQKTSSYKIVKDLNGKRAAQLHDFDLNGIHEEPRERSPSRTTTVYPRTTTSRPSNHRAAHSQPPLYAQPIPASEREREPTHITTVRPSPRGAQTQYSSSRQAPTMYDEVKVAYSPRIVREDIAYAQDFTRRGSGTERFANYPAPDQAFRREEFAPSRKTAFVAT